MTYKLKGCTQASQYFLPIFKGLLVFTPGISAISQTRGGKHEVMRTGEQTEQMYISTVISGRRTGKA
jgi:hypothetical protein